METKLINLQSNQPYGLNSYDIDFEIEGNLYYGILLPRTEVINEK